MAKAIIYDRDGVLCPLVWHDVKRDFTAGWTKEEFSLLPGVKESLEQARKLGYLNLVVTNQPDVFDGFMSINNCNYVAEQLKTTLPIDNVFEAYRRGEWNYKPNPGFIFQLQKMYNLGLDECFVIGDTWKDCLFANLGGVRYIHLGDKNAWGEVYSYKKNIMYAIETISDYNGDYKWKRLEV